MLYLYCVDDVDDECMMSVCEVFFSNYIPHCCIFLFLNQTFETKIQISTQMKMLATLEVDVCDVTGEKYCSLLI